MLEMLHRQAAGRIVILAGSGIDATTVGPILKTGITEVHASCSAAPSDNRDASEAPEHRFGFVSPGRRRTDAARIRALKTQMDIFATHTA